MMDDGQGPGIIARLFDYLIGCVKIEINGAIYVD
jgi:hypothetical protein